MTLSNDDKEECHRIMKGCEMFKRLTDEQIHTLVNKMHVRHLKKDDILIEEGDPVNAFQILSDEGDIYRDVIDPKKEGGRKRHIPIEFEIKAHSINTMRVIGGDLAQTTVHCNSNTCKFFEMHRPQFLNLLEQERPDIGVGVAESLSSHVLESSKKFRMPTIDPNTKLLQQLPSVMIAAGIESYYRSALNSQINRVLTGVKSEMFPNMHVQTPMRIAYIAGFKGLRGILDQFKDDEDDESNETKAKNFGLSIAPGVIMTPISSVLEASNVGHLNKESMYTRWMRGIVARCGREIVFGLGLNQMSDYFQEQFKFPGSPMLSNMVGSLTAGVVSGYFSHVPHNLSTYKLIEPHRSYVDLYKNVFVERSVPPFLEKMFEKQMKESGASTFSTTQQIARFVTATIFPRGLMVRTAQIVGSFIILNGTINYFTLIQNRQYQ